MVNATDTKIVSVNANRIRYSLRIDKFSVLRGFLDLQRAEKRNDGTWMDDPTPGSRCSVKLPTSVDIGPLLAILPTILNITVNDSVRAQLRGSLSRAGVLDVTIIMQYKINNEWKVATIPSLNTWLPQNMQYAQAISDIWAALDTQINAANTIEKWL